MRTKKEIFKNVFITNENAVFLKKTKTIIIADLHIGYEAEKQIQGISFPFFQKNVLIEKLNLIIEKYKPKTIIINGDFKHNFSKNLKQEWNEVIGILKFLKDKTNVILIKGNHDNFLKTIAKSQNAEMVDFYFIENFLLIHGHEDLEKEMVCVNKNLLNHNDKSIKFQRNLERDAIENKNKPIKFQRNFEKNVVEKDNENKKFLKSMTSKYFEKNLILAHEHPSIKLRDELGITVKLPCFLIHRKNKIIVLPAFSPLALGRQFSIAKKCPEGALKKEFSIVREHSKRKLKQKFPINENYSEKYANSNEFLSPILKKLSNFEIIATSEIGLLEF